jgi:hypothetical protein
MMSRVIEGHGVKVEMQAITLKAPMILECQISFEDVRVTNISLSRIDFVVDMINTKPIEYPPTTK